MNDVIENTGNLAEAMEHAKHLLAEDPHQAVTQLEEVLTVVPDYPPALLMRGPRLLWGYWLLCQTRTLGGRQYTSNTPKSSVRSSVAKRPL